MLKQQRTIRVVQQTLMEGKQGMLVDVHWRPDYRTSWEGDNTGFINFHMFTKVRDVHAFVLLELNGCIRAVCYRK